MEWTKKSFINFADEFQQNEFVTVYDSDQSLIVKACGRTPPVPIISSTNSLSIVFKTDGLRNATGFKAFWSTESINSINSPDYPLYYPRFTDEVT